MSSPGTLEFYFDYISHNAYIAWTQLPRLEETYGVQVVPVPTLFAGLLNAYDQMGPAEVPPKAKWMGRNVMRKAILLGVELQPPLHHPFNPLLSLRASSLEPQTDRGRKLIDGLFRAVWVERQHVSDPQTVARVARSAGFDGAELLDRCAETEVKQALRRQTEAALAAGVFGVPSMISDGEVFFGYDDFPYLEMVLAGNDPLDEETLARWSAAAVTPTARRRRPSE